MQTTANIKATSRIGTTSIIQITTASYIPTNKEYMSLVETSTDSMTYH